MNDAKMNQVDNMPDPSRRKFLNTAALAGLAGAGLSVGLSACNKESAPAPAAAGAAPAAAPAAPNGRRQRSASAHGPGRARHLLRRVVGWTLGRMPRPRPAFGA